MGDPRDDLGRWLDERLARRGRRIAVVDRLRYRRLPLSYADLRRRVACCRAHFQARGLKAGDCVLLLGRNCSSWTTALLACFESGLIVVPLDSATDQRLLSQVARETGARLLLTDRRDLSGPPSLSFEALAETLDAPAPRGGIAFPDLSPDAPAEILYTSGSTGSPKGVILTRRNLLAAIRPLLRTVWPLPGLRLLSSLPASHVLEQVAGLLLPLARGWTIVYPDSARPARLLALTRQEKVHGMVTVPGLLEAMRRLLESGPRSPRRALGWRLRLIGVGGAPLPPELERWWRGLRLRVVQGYGMTETSALLAMNSLARARVGSVGRALPGLRLRLAPDGEIEAQGPTLTPGYHGLAEENRRLYTRDGWLRTGDIGEFRGRWLYLRGRKKDVIVTSSGANVHAEDVEAALRRVPLVRDCCVLQRRDRVWAALLLEPGADPARVTSAANRKLLPHQRIAGATVWPDDDFPRTPTRKVRKPAVLERLGELEGRPARPSAPPDPFPGVLARALGGPSDIDPDLRLGEAGLDSLRRLELLSAIEERFSVELPESAVAETVTVAELQRTIEARRSQAPERLPAWQVGTAAAPLRWALRPAAIALARAVTRPRALGVERLRGLRGPLLFAANHESAWDAAVVLACLPRRLREAAIPALPDFWRRGAGLKRLRPGIGRVIGPLFRAYPLGPGAGTEAGLALTGRLVDRGVNILIFPEGARTPDGRMHEFRPGVGVLARELRVPVVPVRVRGMREILPTPRWLVPKGLGRADVRFGEPLRFGPGTDPAEAAKRIQQAVERL